MEQRRNKVLGSLVIRIIILIWCLIEI